MGRKAKHAGVTAKAAIFEVLTAVTDGRYLTCAEIAALAKKQRFVELKAVETCLTNVLNGMLDTIEVDADPRIKKLHPKAKAYRWPHSFNGSGQKEKELL